ncbi:MAG TPA: hypothetical protein VMH01_13615 [Puia sp.]|nr:hypothetical protein [Puia sp.]
MIIKLRTAIKTVFQSRIVSLPNTIITERIMATEAILTVSKNAPIILEDRSLGINGLRKATNRKDGRKMPAVAAIAPPIPLICHPINVADEKTGPGVNWPTAIASTSCCFVIIFLLTSSASRKAKSTYPLP